MIINKNRGYWIEEYDNDLFDTAYQLYLNYFYSTTVEFFHALALSQSYFIEQLTFSDDSSNNKYLNAAKKHIRTLKIEKLKK